MTEPAYTPRAEYQCSSSTTHYQGCQCHEARWAERVKDLEDRLKASEWIRKDNALRTYDGLATKVDELQGRVDTLTAERDQLLRDGMKYAVKKVIADLSRARVTEHGINCGCYVCAQ